MQFAEIKPVSVRFELLRTPSYAALPTHRKYACYVKFWLQSQVWAAGRWQGGDVLLVKRVSTNQFKIGRLPVMTLEEAARYVERELDRYGVPYIGSEPWEHPFAYNI